ncbi:MAG: S41 family peptidase [Candidatus Aminicenantes bacterium]
MQKRRELLCVPFVLLICLSEQLLTLQDSEKQVFEPDKKYAVDELREDFVLLRTALEEAHAGLYFYTPKEEMDSLFDRLYSGLDRPKTELEFYAHLSPLIATINDGHTGLMFSREYDTYLRNQSIVMPFRLLYMEGRAYLLRNYSDDEDVEMGGEVVSINGHPMPEILKNMLAVQPSDGRNVTSKYRRLESTTTFGRRYLQLYGLTTAFNIVYLSPTDGKKKEIRVKGIKREELTKRFNQRYPDIARQRPPIELEYRGDVAILTIRTFSSGSYRNAQISYPLFLKKTFRELSEKNIPHLIIDLRDNGGGEDLWGRLLVSYLMDKPFMYYNFLEVKSTSFSFLEHTDAPDIEKMLQKRTKKNDRGTYDILVHANLGEQKPLKPAYKGKVYVLINGRSFSGSGETTSLMHYHKKAVFVGEECGAGYYGNTSGIMPTLTLPHTKLRIRIPMVRYHMAVSGYDYPDRGIIPDYPFIRSVEDHIKGRDTEMDYVLSLIAKKK